MNKNILIALLVIVVVVVVGVIWQSANGPDTEDNLSGDADKEVISLESLILDSFKNNEIILQVEAGQAIIGSQGGFISLSVPSQRVVSVGDSIKTFADSRAVIVFPNGTISTLDSNTEIVLDKFEDTEIKQSSKIKLISGDVWSRVEQVLDKETEFEVETANSVASVRGTSIWNQYKAGRSLLYVIESSKKVIFQTLDPKTKAPLPGGLIELEAGNKVEADEQEPPTAQKPLSSKPITDADRNLDFFKLNIKQNVKVLNLLSSKSVVGQFQILRPSVKLSEKIKMVIEAVQTEVSSSDEPKSTPSSSEPKKDSPKQSSSVFQPAATEPAISISGVSPQVFENAGYGFANTKIVITGANLSGDITGFVGASQLKNLKITSVTSIEAEIPSDLAAGTYDVALKKGATTVYIKNALTIKNATQ